MDNHLFNSNMRIRREHLLLTLNTIRQSAPMSRVELVEKTQLSKPTITRVTEELLDRGLIMETGFAESKKGRKATYLELCPNSIYCVGLNLSKNNIYGSIIDIAMNVCYSAIRPLKDVTSAEEFIEYLLRVIEEIMDESKIPQEKIIGIGIGVPGLVDFINGVIRRLDTKNIIHGIEITKAVQERFSLPSLVDNNANTRALGEYWFGHGAENGNTNLIYVVVSEGVGMGVISGGELVRGKSNQSTELGDIIVNIDGPPHMRRLEDYCSTDAIEAATGLPFAEACERAKNDPETAALFDRAAKALGASMAGMIALFDPESVIMSGNMFDGAAGFYERVLRYTKDFGSDQDDILFYNRHTKDALYEAGVSALIYKAFFND